MSAIREAIGGPGKRRRLASQLLALGLAMAAAGCRGAKDHAAIEKLNEAKQQAALTGVAQRVVYRGKDGRKVIAVVEPPAPGDPTERIATTIDLSGREPDH